MKAAIILVPDLEFQNRCNSWTLRLTQYGFGLLRLRLPVHVSMKQPFEIHTIHAAEQFFDRLAVTTAQLELLLKGFYYFGDLQHGVVGLHVVEIPQLRQMHEQLNVNLERELGGTQAEFDGAAYRFHLTLSIGQPLAARFEQMQADLLGWQFEERIVVKEVALCLYEPLPDGRWEYGVYKTLQLMGK